MPTYNGRINREQGASVLTIASGGSINFAAGGIIQSSGVPVFSGGFTLGQASGQVVSGGMTEYKSGACFSFNLTGPSETTFRFVNGTSTPSILVGKDTPVVFAPMGSLYIRAQGSMSGVYVMVGADSSGSVWRWLDQTSAV